MLRNHYRINKNLIIGLGFDLIEKQPQCYYFLNKDKNTATYLYSNYCACVKKGTYRPTIFDLGEIQEFIDYVKRTGNNK